MAKLRGLHCNEVHLHFKKLLINNIYFPLQLEKGKSTVKIQS